MEGNILIGSSKWDVTMLGSHYSAHHRGHPCWYCTTPLPPLFYPCRLRLKKVSLLGCSCFCSYGNFMWGPHSEILANSYPKAFSHLLWVNHALPFGTDAVVYLDLSAEEWWLIWLDVGFREADVYAPQPKGKRVEEHFRVISDTRCAESGKYA